MAVDRETSKGAAEVFARLVPSSDERAAVHDVLSHVVQYVSRHPERWAITLKRKLVRLNAGTIFVVDVREGAIRFVFEPNLLTAEQRLALETAKVTFKSEKFQVFPNFEVAVVPVAALPSAWPNLKAAALAAIDGAASWGKCPFRNSHSPGVLAYLGETMKIDLGTGPVATTSSIGDLLQRSYASANLAFTTEQIASFFTAMQVKGFVILTGISGTGKSKLAQHFVRALGGTVDPASRAETDEDSRIRTKPYMIKHQHLIVPKRLAQLIEAPPVGESVEIDLHFPGGSERVRLSNRKYSSTAYLVLAFRGSARDWVRSELHKVESFLLEKIAASDGTLTGFRIVVEKSQGATTMGARQLFLPVRPDWRDGTELLGFYNPVTETYESRPFVEFLEDALEAWERGDTHPFIVMFDEMNLARVEYYFADLLSVLESGRRADGCTEEAIHLSYPETVATTDAPRRKLVVPPNFFIVGTINSDETTHAFSPKVLDRAFTIELNDVDFDLSYGDVPQPLTGDERAKISKVFSTGGKFPRIDRIAATKLVEARPQVRERLQDLSDALKHHDMHFGYRVFDEIVMFLVHAERNGLFGPDGFDDAFDAAVLMKVLPKFHGSRGKLEGPLLTMLRWCVQPDDELIASDEAYASLEVVLAHTASDHDVQLPATASRIRRMLRTLESTGFASFG